MQVWKFAIFSFANGGTKIISFYYFTGVFGLQSQGKTKKTHLPRQKQE
jgi:hypothetical protein